MPDDTAADPGQVIAELARELAQYKTALAEALAQQTATAEVLQVINSSPGDLVPVFDAMLDKAIRLCDGAQGTLWMFDGDRQYAAAAAGVSAEVARQLREPQEIHPYQRRSGGQVPQAHPRSAAHLSLELGARVRLPFGTRHPGFLRVQ
jgi:hypothetical protein